MLRLDVIDDAARLEALRPEWQALLSRSATCEPTLSPDWLLPWWRVFGGIGARRLAVLAFREAGGRLQGLAPLLCRRQRYRGLIPFQTLELLGTGEDEADETCSEYLNVLAARGSERRVARAFARALQGDGGCAWDDLRLAAMDGEARMTGLLRDALTAGGLPVVAVAMGDAPYIPLPGSFSDYLARLPSRRRYVIRRALRDLRAHAGGDLRLRAVEAAADLPAGAEILRRLHLERWAAAGRPGAFASPRFRDFHDEVMAALFRSGALDLLWLELRGRPVAALYNIVWGGKVYFYQSGRATDLPASLRPGIAIHALAIERAIARGLGEYDFLGGKARYKEQLALARRPLVTLRASRPSLRDVARRLARRGAARARDLRAAVRQRLERGEA